MAFTSLFIAHAPDADPQKHHSIIDTGKYRLLSFVVKDQAQALEVSKSFYAKEKIDAIILCPGFTHGDVAEIFQALEGKVAVCVARGDGPSGRISQAVIQREFYGK